MMNTAYFARPMSQYKNKQDNRDLDLIQDVLGYNVILITTKLVQLGAKEQGMSFFKPLVESADILFFRAFADGSIGAGVHQEIMWALDRGIPVLELPTGLHRRQLSATATREMLTLLGER